MGKWAYGNLSAVVIKLLETEWHTRGCTLLGVQAQEYIILYHTVLHNLIE